MAEPYLEETENPIPGQEALIYLNDKSLLDRDFAVFIVVEKRNEERE